MATPTITLALRDYDHVGPLAAGDVTPEGVDLTLIRSFDALTRVTGDPAVDGGEASFSRYVQGLAAGDRAWVGLPAFVMREFRHRCFFVRRDSDLTDVAQLAGRRVGTDGWPNSGNTWSRAIIRERGVSIRSIRWLVGPVNPGYRPSPPDALPEGVEPVPAGSTLTELLLGGELDAIMCPWPPAGFYDEGSPIRRLYVDFRAAEREHYQRTRILPAHHVVVLKRDVVERNPTVVGALFTALDESRKLSEKNRWSLADTVPWLLADLEEARELMGPEFKPYGVEANRHVIEAFCEEQIAQRLVSGPLKAADVFADFERLTTGS
jgi:4,5-dihydroxyphthalate decarboxylase